MSPLRVFILAVVMAILGAVAAVTFSGHMASGRAMQAELQAATLKGERDEKVREANREQAQRAEAEPRLQQARARVVAAKAKVSAAPVSETPGVPPVDGADAAGDLKELVAAQDDVIQQQDAKIASLERENADLREAVDLGMKRERALEIALDAQKRANVSSKWWGRIQGLAVGLAGGYVGGRLR